MHSIAAEGLDKLMPAAAKQIAIGGMDTPEDVKAEIEAGYVWREQLWSAMRTFCASYMSNGMKGFDAVAAELDRRWGEKGRPVSASVLGAALKDSERNNFRLEWVDWFAARDPDIADLLARRVRPAKTDAQYAKDLEDEFHAELSHKRATAAIKRARDK